VVSLRIVRRAARLTQRKLAALAGVDHSFISLIEAGERDLRSVGYETVVLIAAALNVDPADLVPVSVDGVPRTS
jgi:transcriptional regulator with XRE-family HTH domain